MKKVIACLVLGLLTLQVTTVASAQKKPTTKSVYQVTFTEQEVFPDRFNGAFTHFRIPSLVVTPTGCLLAFCEGRFQQRDWGDTDIIMKVSRDGGRNWKHCRLANNHHELIVGGRSVGAIPKTANWRNPTSVYAKNAVYLFLSVDEGGESQGKISSGKSRFKTRFFFTHTNPEREWNDGIRWSPLREIVVPHTYYWGATGPGRALYLKGRLIVPANTNRGKENKRSFCFISDDLGKTWRFSGPAGSSTENQITNLSDGRLLMSKRAAGTQNFWVSADATRWSRLPNDTSLVTPLVQTGLLTDPNGTILISGPAHRDKRIRMSLWCNERDGAAGHWGRPIPLEAPGPGFDLNGYSCIAALPAGRLVVIYEDSKRGSAYRRIVAAGLVRTAKPVNKERQ
jgi:sialidase-1